jgi:hypothetical protein
LEDDRLALQPSQSKSVAGGAQPGMGLVEVLRIVFVVSWDK